MAAQSMPAISIDINMFWQIINFFILIVIFNKYLKKPLLKVLDERREKISTDIDEAKKNKEMALAEQEEAAKILREAKNEAQRIITSAERKADERRNEILKGATSQRDKMLKSAEVEVEKMKEKASSQIKQDMEGLAVILAEKIIKEKLDSEKEKTIVDDFINQIGAI